MKKVLRTISIMLAAAMLTSTVSPVFADEANDVGEAVVENQGVYDAAAVAAGNSESEEDDRDKSVSGIDEADTVLDDDNISEIIETENDIIANEENENGNEEDNFEGVLQSEEERSNEIMLFDASNAKYVSVTDEMITYQDEDYEGDFLDSFDVTEWENTTDRGLMAKVSKVEDPENPDNHVLTVDGTQNTNQRFPKNTCVAFYQGEMNNRNVGYSGYTPEALGLNDGILVFKIDAYFKSEMKNYKSFYLIPSSNRTAYHKYCTFDGCYIKAKDDNRFLVKSNVLKEGEYLANYNEWHTFTFVYDCKTQKAGYYVDGTLVWYDTTNQAWRLSLAVGFKMFMDSCLVPANVYFFDNVQILRPLTEPELLSASLNHTTGKVELMFSSSMNRREIEKIKLKKKNGDDVSDYIKDIEFSDDGKTAYLVLNKAELANETEYTVFIPGGKEGVKDSLCRIISETDIENAAEFKIGRTFDLYVKEKNLKSIKINSKAYDDTADLNDVNSISYKTKIVNDTAENKSVTAMLGVYGKDDILLDSITVNKTISYESEEEFSFELNKAYGERITDIRLYTFDNSEGRLRPIHEPDVLIGEYLDLKASTEKLLPDGFSVLLSDKENNYISIVGNFAGEAAANNKSIITAVFDGKDGSSDISNAIAIGTSEVKADGSFKYSFKLNNKETVKYSVKIYADSGVYEQEFDYISINDIADFVEAVANGEVAYDNYYTETLPLSGLIGTDFGVVVETQRDIDLFNRRIDEGRDGYIGENDEITVTNYNKVLSEYVKEARYLQSLDNISDKSEIYQKLLNGTEVTNIQFGFYNTLIAAQADVVLSAFVNQSFTCKEEIYELFNEKVAEAQKYFPDKANPDKKQFSLIDFENNYNIDNFKGNYDKNRYINTANVKVVNDPTNADNHVLTVSGNTAVSSYDGKEYSQTSLLLSEEYDGIKKYSDYGIDFDNSIIVWKCDFYFDSKFKDYIGGGCMLQPSTAGGYDGGTGVNHNTQFRNINSSTDTVRYEFMYISTFDDENSVGAKRALCDQWHTMTQVYDARTKKISTFIDDEIVVINQKVNVPLSDNSLFGLKFYRSKPIPENVVYFDNIEHYAMTKRPGIEAYTYNPISGVVTIEFATPIDNSNLNKFTMTKNGEDVGNLIKLRSLDKTGHYVTITLDKEQMELNSEYMFSIPTSLIDIFYQPISDKKVEFSIDTGKTKTVYIDDKSPKAVLEYNGKTLAEANAADYTMIVNNVTENGIDVMAAVCVYGEKNELLASQFKNTRIPSGGGNIKFDVYGFKGAKYIGLYLFKVDENGNPTELVHIPDYIEDKYEFTQSALTSAVLPEYSVMTSDVEKKIISIVGNASDKASNGIVMTCLLSGKDTGLENIEESIVAIGAADVVNGDFNYSFKYSGDSGEYTAYVFTDTGIYKKNVSYTTFDDTVQFIKNIKDGGINQNDIYSETLKYSDVLGVDLKYTVKTNRDIVLLNNYVNQNRGRLAAAADIDYLNNYKKILQTALREIRFLQELEQINYYGLVYAKLNEYKDVNYIDFSEFNKLSDTKKAEVAAALIGITFADANDVKSRFNAETNKAKANEGSGSGSSKGNGGTTQTPKASNNIIAADYKTQNALSGFADLEGFEWAHEAIMSLKTKGIISGVSEKEFMPNSTVTREQFVKMLMLAIDENDSTAECGLRDVNKSAWYYPFVSSAINKGIVTGISENEFGIGRSISRQDMACLVYRAMAYKGISFTDKKTDFDDFNTIMSYAQEAVSALAGFGIINGMDNNTFAPQSTATRAQAAVIIDSMLRRIK